MIGVLSLTIVLLCVLFFYAVRANKRFGTKNTLQWGELLTNRISMFFLEEKTCITNSHCKSITPA